MTEKVDVKFGLAFVQLINVNEKNQIMKSNVWLRLVSTRKMFYSYIPLLVFSRCGRITSYNGTKPITEELQFSGYHRIRFGNQI